MTNTNKRFFNIQAAALVLATLVEDKVIDRELEVVKVVATADSTHADKAVHLLRGVTTQGSYASIIVNLTHGEGKTIDGASMTEALREAFPNAGISDRHGPHYLCHARTAIKVLAKNPEAENASVKCMKGLRTDLEPLPTERRKARAKKEEEVVEALTVEILTKDNDLATLIDMAKGMKLKVSKSMKPETVAKKIVDFMAVGTEVTEVVAETTETAKVVTEVTEEAA